MIWPDPTHQPTQPPTHPPTKPHTHPCVGNSSQISNLRTELKYLDKLKCYRILSDSGGLPPWGGVADGWMGVGAGMGVWGDVPCMHACTGMHTHTYACTCMLNMLNMDASMSAAICNFYTCINVRVCICVCAHACACVWGHPPCPQMPPHPPAPSPEPQGAQNTKIQ